MTKSRPTTAVSGKDRARRAGVSEGVYPSEEEEEEGVEEEGAWTAATADVAWGGGVRAGR